MSSANQINFNKSIITQRYKLNTRRMLKDEAQISSFFFPLLKKKKIIIKIDLSRLFLFLPERIAPTFDRRWTLYRIKKIKQLKIKNFNFFFFLNSIWQKSWTPKMIRSGGSPKGGGPRRTKNNSLFKVFRRTIASSFPILSVLSLESTTKSSYNTNDDLCRLLISFLKWASYKWWKKRQMDVVLWRWLRRVFTTKALKWGSTSRACV